MHIEDLLKEFGQVINLPELELDDHNVCHIIFNDRYDVTLETDPDRTQLYIHAAIGKMPIVNQAPYYEKLLELSLFGQGLGGAATGLDPMQGDIILWRKFDAEQLDTVVFTKAMESFLHILGTVRQTLDPLCRIDESATAPKADIPLMARLGTMGQGMLRA